MPPHLPPVPQPPPPVDMEAYRCALIKEYLMAAYGNVYQLEARLVSLAGQNRVSLYTHVMRARNILRLVQDTLSL